MTVSIIGTNGLLATELGLFCNKKGMNVKAFGRRKPDLYAYNQFDTLDLMTEQIDLDSLLDSDVIFYTAGAGIQSNLKDSFEAIYKLNTYIPILLCKSLSEKGFKGTLVTFGSCFEIGNNNESVVFDEDNVVTSVLDVPNDYCVSKRIFTRYATSDNLNSFTHLHIILPTIYGEKEATHRLIPYTVSAIKNKAPMQFTKGTQIRQYLYAGDIPAIVFSLIDKKYNGVINISGVETYTVRQIVEMIYSFYGIEITEELFGKAERSDIGMLNLQLDGTKLENILPELNYTTFTDSLKLYDLCL
ncbi:NAD(P)-dependent oxidoreductase [Chryseobacterium sp. RG1]|uniref:NAD(P)-dependent oxidoreductase n=1 Tax=Chryseobacterium tagetis TaxID=2801334 RepID=A0ABS8A5P9_9FLAO|nr:NAD(P)-dependent oxidoreductase [Chryseobacterium tagetis]MCA6069100.1 NAD(P)-dependent oxidoreductase [Chryseobacterium tagetis]